LAWLLGIARNKLRESARRGSIEIEARQRLGIPAIAFEDEDILRVQEMASVGEEALELLEQLPAAQRDAIRARVLEEQDYERLALELGHSQQVVRQHVSRGLRRLRTLMEEKQ
jgi:RNA polymerase sigma-70 factor (ECF subfamily)